MSNMQFSQNLTDNIAYLHKKLNVDANFDVVYRVIHVGGRDGCLYFIDGFTKDDTILRILQAFPSIKPEDMPPDATDFPNSTCPTGKSAWWTIRSR